MALSNNTKIDKSFRALINKEFTSTSKTFYEEFGANTINTNTTEIWSQTISSTPTTAISDGVAKKYTDFVLSPALGYDNEAFYFASGSGWTPGDDVDRPTINENLLQRNFISTKYGIGYDIILKDNNNTQIQPTDPIDWQFDYQTGILTIQDSGEGTYSKPYKVTVYQYIGDVSSKTIGESLKSGSVAGSTLTFEKNDGTTFDLTVAGGATPGGSDTEIQFNSGGSALGGSPRFTFDNTGLTKLSGSFQITSSTINDIFLIKSGSIEVAKVNNEGVFVLGEMEATPTAITGGMYYSASEFYVGVE
jgi:hypothetical protein